MHLVHPDRRSIARRPRHRQGQPTASRNKSVEGGDQSRELGDSLFVAGMEGENAIVRTWSQSNDEIRL